MCYVLHCIGMTSHTFMGQCRSNIYIMSHDLDKELHCLSNSQLTMLKHNTKLLANNILSKVTSSLAVCFINASLFLFVLLMEQNITLAHGMSSLKLLHHMDAKSKRQQSAHCTKASPDW